MRESEEDLARRLRGYSWSLMRNALQKLALDGRDQIKDVAVEDCFDTGSRRAQRPILLVGHGWLSSITSLHAPREWLGCSGLIAG